MGAAAADDGAVRELAPDSGQNLLAGTQDHLALLKQAPARALDDEGLQVRARGREQLEDSLKGVEKARKQLRKKAREVLGRELEENASADEP